ncbi:proteolipid membrane potential modulator domain-containing protein [Ditylenchus destructor]|nr:proteolipid membrane potential modulator domain-containing protein [Ditylenchus destructor]
MLCAIQFYSRSKYNNQLVNMAYEAQAIIEFILCIILPPVAIFFHANDLNVHVLISIILCFLFWLPAVIHAFWYCFFNR